MHTSFCRAGILCLVVLLVLAGGCTSTGGTVASPSLPAQQTGTVSSGAAVDFHNDAEREAFLAGFDAYAENALKDWNVPGMAVAVVKDGRVVFAKGYGVRTAGGSDPVSADTVFQIGSTSKAFTAALAAMEVDSGRMHWDDPVIRYVPDFAMKDPWVTREYTIVDSLAQRSGLEGYWGTDLGALGYSRSEMIHALRYAEPVSSFRSQFRYQNLPFVVTAAAVEKTGGRSWEEDLFERIFKPLAMTSASTGQEAFFASPDHVSVHIMGRYPGNTTGPVVKDVWDFNDFTTLMGPAGGINANVKDMATWAIFQLGNGTYNGNRLISPENMAYMHSPKTPVADAMPKTKMYYCTGWMYEEPAGRLPSMVWHNGATFGNHAMVLLVPDENLGIVVLSNVSDPPLPDQLARTFYNRYFGEKDPDLAAAEALQMFRDETEKAYLSPAPVPPADAAEPRALSAYTGTYTSDIYGTATVAEQGGNLLVTFSKKGVVYHLAPWDGDTFFATCPAWSDDFHDSVTFDTGADGSIRQMVLPIMANPPYTGTFVRA